MRSRLSVWCANGLRVALLVALAGHFALTGAYVVEANPLSRTLAPLFDSYTDKYFAQVWALFAPNPISANLSLMVRPLTQTESAAVGREGVPENGWYDLTRALWERRQRKPFSSDQALGHFEVVMIQHYLDGDSAGFPSLYACREDSAAACEAAKVERVQARERAALYLWRLGSGFVNGRFSASAYPAMALKIREELPTPWRERASGRRQTRDIPLGVYATDASRSPLPVPAVEVRP